ncbi:hypothetical protein D5F01_LYC04745 [Larimichthys crocea]|uniref:FAM192A/Fyv6 N-terminal domain-containing protein n=1 Tax=Larimichthys crocea TaxID=215358 RepID=A0A6G0IXN2_LARCR|nr:hypothetical protein D5F01_LYC04745 [Larimichthys crocea]
MAGGGAPGVDLSRKFVSETELDEKRKKRQEEWEKVRKPEDPEEAPEEEYDPRSLFERLQEQKDKKQEEYEEQFKFKQEAGSGGGAGGAEDQQTVPGLTAKTPSAPLSSGQGVLHLPSAAVCVGVLPGLWVYSGSSDSDSSSDSEGSVDAIMLPYPRHSRAYR